MEKLVDPMSRCSLQALQNVNQRERPTLLIPKGSEQQMDMVRHDHGCVQTYPRCTCGAGALARLGRSRGFSQTVFKH